MLIPVFAATSRCLQPASFKTIEKTLEKILTPLVPTLEVNGKLLAISTPLPGARHDAHAFRTHGLDQLLNSSTLADKGYVGLGASTPTKRKPG